MGQRAVSGGDPFALNHSLACLDRPEDVPLATDPTSLLQVLITISDSRGRYFADPAMVWARMIRQWGTVTGDDVRVWMSDLSDASDIVIAPLARDCYGGSWVDVYTVQNLSRFHRWRNRVPISAKLRARVYERDGHACVHCGATEPLSIDHIVPWSKGGPDVFENFQTLCRPCNSRKGARVNAT